jgi:GAF domain-containing protein
MQSNGACSRRPQVSSRYTFNRDLVEAARAMAAEQGTAATLHRAAQMAVDVLDRCDYAGISIVRSTGIETPAATDEALRRIDELQYELDEGPCLAALRESEVVVTTNLAEDERWPSWGTTISRELDIHSSLSVRLFTGHKALGALNCYALKTDAFTGDDVLDAQVVAAHAAVALADTLKEEHLRRAMETRRVIGEATGILRERFGLTTDQAFSVLQRLSSTHNVKLFHVARTLVYTGRLPEEECDQDTGW